MTSKECRTCHITKPLDGFNKNCRSKDGHRSQCRECNSIGNKKYRTANRERINEYLSNSRHDNPEATIRRQVLDKRKYTAKKKGMEYNLTKEWRADKLSTGKCERTGMPFVYEFNSPYIPSVDRIDSSKGYIEDNCQMVISAYNKAKNVWSDEFMLEMAKALLKESKNHK